MTLKEMKKLKVGDILIDKHMTMQQKDNTIVLCKIIKIDKDIGVVCDSVDNKYKMSYPHRFWFKESQRDGCNDIEKYHYKSLKK